MSKSKILAEFKTPGEVKSLSDNALQRYYDRMSDLETAPELYGYDETIYRKVKLAFSAAWKEQAMREEAVKPKAKPRAKPKAKPKPKTTKPKANATKPKKKSASSEEAEKKELAALKKQLAALLKKV